MNINYDYPIKNLPDAFKKDADSNNYKLLQINKKTTDTIKDTAAKLFSALNLNNAKGKVLDDIYGGRINLRRGALTDEQYIIRLRTKMMQNIADGSFPDLIEALAYALQCDKSMIHIVESDTPNRVKIEEIPFKIILDAGFAIDDITVLIENMLPVGVCIDESSFSGAFEFGDVENVYDADKGFSDEDNKIGGYFGVDWSRKEHKLNEL